MAFSLTLLSMANPLSIAGFVVRVASLGIQITQSFIDVYDAYKDQSSDLARNLHSFENLTDSL